MKVSFDRSVVGMVVRTREAVKPLYMSVGYRIRLFQAAVCTLLCATLVRLP